MAGKKGHSGPPGNANAFRHGLSTVVRRRSEGELTEAEQDIRADILAGLIADKGGENQIGTAERILAEVISSDVALLVTFNQAIDGVLKNNQKARANPKALAQLDGYKRPGRLVIGESSAVRDGTGRQIGVVARNHCGNRGGRSDRSKSRARLSKYGRRKRA
jgi:hypothetical protein